MGGTVAVYLQRRLPRHWLASVWPNLVLAASVAASFRLATGRLPPLPWPSQSSASEPWELVVLPLMLVTAVWPFARSMQSITMRLWFAMALASGPLFLSLPVGETYADVVPGNAAWSLFALLAIGANYLAGEQLETRGAARWSLWVFVAQLFTVAALLMTCYGTLGEWSASLALALGVLAACRVFTSEGTWTSDLGLPATVLSCVLLTHIRVYSTQALPAWLAPLPMLSPVVVCAVDQCFGRHRQGWKRWMTAAATAAIVAVTIVATVLALGGQSTQEW